MSEQLQGHLVNLFTQSLDPAHVATANKELSAAESQPGFLFALLQIVSSGSVQPSVRQVTAIYFKNHVSRSWEDLAPQADQQQAIKTMIVQTMSSAPPQVQVQLAESIRIIAGKGFHEHWPTLIKELTDKISTETPELNNAIYKTMHSIFSRWRTEQASDELFLEILHVFSGFGNKFIEMVQVSDQAITALEQQKPQLEVWIESMTHLAELFYDLTCQDLVEIIENNFAALWSVFFKYFTYSNPLLEEDDETPGALEKLKVAVLEVLHRHVEQYSESFQPGDFNGMLTQGVSLISGVTDSAKYDLLVCRCSSLLIGLGRFVKYCDMSESDLKMLIEKVVLPNIRLRESDLETLEDEPLDFIQRDLVGMEQDTRRRAASDFLRALMNDSIQTVTGIVFGYIGTFLEAYEKDKQANWAQKDNAITLFSCISSRGHGTISYGVTELNELVNVAEFYERHIVPELSVREGHVVILVDAVKFLYSFRNQLPSSHYQSLFPRLVDLLSSGNPCVYSVAALALTEMIPKITSGKSVEENMSTYSLLFERLFKLLLNPGSSQEQQGNEFLMRCAMRTVFSMGASLKNVVDRVSQPLHEIMQKYLRSTSNPRFSYYYFETLGTLIRFAPAESQQAFDFYTSFFSSLSSITDSDYSGYVMQLLCALLEWSDRSYPLGENGSYYQGLFSWLLKLESWKENMHNTVVLARLFGVLVDRFSEKIKEADQLTNVLGIFQLLHSNFVSAPFVEAAFLILRAVFRTFEMKREDKYLGTIFGLLLNKLASAPTSTLEQRKFYAAQFAAFEYSLFTLDDPFTTKELLKLYSDLSLPAGQIVQMHNNFVFKSTGQISNPVDRKIAIVGLVRMLSGATEGPEGFGGMYVEASRSLVELLVNPPEVGGDPEVLTEEVDEVSLSAKVTLLRSTRTRAAGPLSEIVDVAGWTKQTLSEAVRASDSRGGQLRGWIVPELSGQL